MLTITTLEKDVLKIISDVTGHEVCSLDVEFTLDSDLGIDSIKQIDVLQKVVQVIPEALRQKFVENGGADVLRGACTVGDLIKCISGWLGDKSRNSEYSITNNFVTKNEIRTDDSVVLNALSCVTGIEISDLDMEMRLDTDLGIDSIKQVSLINHLGDSLRDKDTLTAAVTNGRFTDAATVGALLDLFKSLTSKEKKTDKRSISNALKSESTGEVVPLVYAQYQHVVSHYAMDSSSLCSRVRIRGDLNVKKLRTAWQNLVERHPALRLKFSGVHEATHLSALTLQEVTSFEVPEIELGDICHLSGNDQNRKLDTILSDFLMRVWDIEQWPLHDFSLVRTDSSTHYLFLSIHHLVADGLSNQIILRELFTIYDEIDGGAEQALPQTLSMKEYISSVKVMNSADDELDASSLNIFTKRNGKDQFKWHPTGSWSKSHKLAMRSQLFTLNVKETEELRQKVSELNVSLNSLLVATLLRVASRVEGHDNRFFVNIPTSGRIYEEIELMDAVSDLAQNIALDFDCSSAQGDWVLWSGYVHNNIQEALANGYDRLMIKQVADVARATPLSNGRMPALQRNMLANGVKSNLYLSCVGDSAIRTDYTRIKLDDYHPATVTVRGGIDNLVELFGGRLYWSINYDASVIADEDIRNFGSEMMQAIRELISQTIVQESDCNKTDKNSDVLAQDQITRFISVASDVLSRSVGEHELGHHLVSQLGMDSLQRIRLIMRLRRTWPTLDAASAIKCSTLAEISKLISEKGHNEEKPLVHKKCDYLSVHEFVDAQCEKTPDAVAIKDDKKIMTYRELALITNQLANYLRSHGVERNSLVAVMMNRGIDMIVAILGILKAGGAYVPIDTSYPEERQRYILQHSEAKLLLTQSCQSVRVHGIAEGSGVSSVIYVDQTPSVSSNTNLTIVLPADIRSCSTHACESVSQQDDLMVVLYTSGSTGNPKGVLLAHAGYINRLEWMAEAVNISAADNVAFKTSCCFDISVWEIFLPLMYGATLLPVEREVVLNPWALSQWMNAEKITIMHFVPSLFGEFLAVSEEESFSFPQLRWLIFSGEALPVNFVRRWMNKYKNSVSLANLYGPTEASIDVTAHMITEIPGENQHSIPIGMSLPNTTMLVLDENMQRCENGVVGELYIAGVQLAKGYLKDKEKTKKAFLDNPFSDVPGSKVYRTGDLAVRSTNGEIDYRGRVDSQVKIRGFRVELGEIEAVFQSHHAVSEAVALVEVSCSGDKKLRIIIHPKDATVDLVDLQNYVSRRLPDYMLPSQINTVHEIPRNHNGKIDRKKLEVNFSSNERAPSLPKEVDNIYPLAPAQRWLVNHFEVPYFWAGLHQFRYNDALDTEVFKKALASVVDIHPALRTNFVSKNGELYQHVLNTQEVVLPISFFEGAHLSADEIDQAITRLVSEFKESVKLDQGALWRVYCIRESERSHLFVLICHHMVCDMLSSPIFMSDLWRSYCDALVDPNGVNLRKATSMIDLVETLSASDKEQLLHKHENYWRQKFPSEHARFQVPLDQMSGRNDEKSEEVHSIRLASDISSRIMTSSKKSCDVSLYPVLLSALYKSLAMWSHSSWVVVSHRTHGRLLDGSNNYFDSIGNFAVNYPVGVNISPSETYEQLVKKISETIDAVPMKGVSYDYLGGNLPKHIYPDNKLTSVRANYLGNRTAINSDLFKFEKDESDRRLSFPDNERTTLIEYIFSILNGEIVLDISYSNNFHHAETIEAIANMWQACMMEAMRQFETTSSTISELG